MINQDILGDFASQIKAAGKVLILQPEKPDTDSLSATLALEHILGDLGKEVYMYSKDNLPPYIAYFEGADRLNPDFPDQFDLCILVDCGGPQQIDRTLELHQAKLAKKPFFIIDHHANREPLPFTTIDLIDSSVNSTCELVLDIAQQFDWKVSTAAANRMVPGILADTRNLSIHSVTADTFRAMGELVDLGADVPGSHEAFRKISALSPELLLLKGRLLSRVELFADDKLALLVVTPTELKQYAESHDPANLVIYDMMNAMGVEIAAVIRNYGGPSKKIKISTRASMPVAAKSCQAFGGGGHDRAAGAQTNGRPIDEVKAEFVKVVTENIKNYEADQHSN